MGRRGFCLAMLITLVFHLIKRKLKKTMTTSSLKQRYWLKYTFWQVSCPCSLDVRAISNLVTSVSRFNQNSKLCACAVGFLANIYPYWEGKETLIWQCSLYTFTPPNESMLAVFDLEISHSNVPKTKLEFQRRDCVHFIITKYFVM